MRRTVLCNGCFDLLHIGHLLHFQAAARKGDCLVVSVTKDEFVNKGEGRPVFTQEQRCAMVGALKCVDSVVLVSSSLEALKLVRPQIFVKGREYAGKINNDDYQFCKAHGIEIAFTDEPCWSSTKLLQHYARFS